MIWSVSRLWSLFKCFAIRRPAAVGACVRVVCDAALVIGLLRAGRVYADSSRGEVALRGEAVALLRGTESKLRTKVRGEMTIIAEYVNPTIKNVDEFNVTFDEDKVRFEAASGDKTCVVYDGKQVIAYDGVSGVTMDAPDLQDKTALYLFDPRTIGINSSYHLEQGIIQCLGYRDARDVRLVGTEPVGGVAARKVDITDKHGATRSLWIDPTGFRVLKFVYVDGEGLTQVSTPSYQDDEVIPSKVSVEWFDSAGKPNGQTRTLTVQDARFGQPIDAATFTLQGMKVPLGVPVVDLRIKERLGYWNGSGVSTSVEDAGSKAISDARGGWRYVAFGANVLVILFAVLMLWLRSSRRARA
jgi:outer membrane lipoprotein-sorting protein